MDNGVFYDPKQNIERIFEVEKLFGFPSNKLVTSNRVLVGEGVLTKICRRKPKLRHFFLFSDVLIYGRIVVNRKVLRNPQFIDLADSCVKNVVDNGIYRNGFSILSPRKSFTVYASTSEEKTQWVVHLKKCISSSASSGMQYDSVKKSPIWIPDSEASHCMVCGTTEFNLVHRRHHCRHCGKVVCDKCSTYRWILPYQGSSRVRVCSVCHTDLSTEKNNSLIRNNQQQYQCEKENSLSSVTTCVTNNKVGVTNETTDNCIITPTYLGDVNMINDELNTESDTDSDTTEDEKVDKFIHS
ncbi:putative zinc finger protein [Schistosoma mansoni]|uniref:Putative zinc finger protein n=1 Tax=Schistosoma mansoni TaxID=6183 RepID=G4VH72_SCHMA|nr:putative zinc finger protein [Schistosoma mansoni]|eukprot:XP_018652339.1 putative zinc finger protein [Schistosoma mansoni]